MKIPWNGPIDDWCDYLFKANGKYYGYSRLDGNTAGLEFEISH